MVVQEMAEERSSIVKSVTRVASVNFVAADAEQDEETLKDEGVTTNNQGSRPWEHNRYLNRSYVHQWGSHQIKAVQSLQLRSQARRGRR